MEYVFLIGMGLFLFVIGLLNFFGNISSIHFYNRTKVKPKDEKKYGKVVGFGTIFIGCSIVICSIFHLIFKNEFIYIVECIGIFIGVLIILYGQFKYNKGIF